MVLLAIVFVVAPLIELYVIIQVAHVIGAWPTIAFLVAESLVGAWLIKRQGRRVLHRIQAQLEGNRLPTKELVDGGLVLVAGMLMVAPGFITDLFGFLLLFPPTRAIARSALMRHFKDRLGTGYSFLGGSGVGGFVFGSRGGDLFDTTGREQVHSSELPPGPLR
jgi:UPF0716 protein FxsA